MKFTSLVLFVCFINTITFAQTSYEIDAGNVSEKDSLPINMKAENPQGERLSVNNQYFKKDGKPWFILMGEMHYNRVPRSEWDEELKKMKAAGLNTVATYIFWNEHETAPGTWNWNDNKDLRHFIELCEKNNLYVWLRIGPWSHGEQLNGGFPNYVQQMKGTRTNNPEYLAAATKLFQQTGIQTKGLFFKDGGPVIGAQLENEYASGQAEHISMLKKMALDAGITPVFWSVTANTVFDDSKMEVIPLQGAYPYRGWEKAGGGPSQDFLYGDDQWIMTGALGKLFYDITKFPKGMCEQGCGSQVTFKNRFIVDPHIVEAHLQNQLGRGMNIIGYYMFHGGTQNPGLEEPGLPLSYDFQAPIGEFGMLQPSYKYLKILHYFIDDFGSDLATMQTIQSPNPVHDPLNTKDLRYTARVKGNSGYLFLCNAQKGVIMPDKNISVTIKLKDEAIQFPAINLKGQTSPVLPFNFKVNGVLIKYATAQLFTKINNDNHTTIFFQELPGVKPELLIDANTIKNYKADEWPVQKSNNTIHLQKTSGNSINITANDGSIVTLVFISRQEAEQSWKATINGKQALIITASDVIPADDSIRFQQLNDAAFNFKVYPAGINGFSKTKNITAKKDGLFDEYKISVPPIAPSIKITYPQKNKAVIQLPKALPANVSNIMLNTTYYGSSCDAIANNKPVTDNLENGQPWMLSLKRFAGYNTLTLKINEWNDDITGVPDKLVKQIKANGSSFTAIKALPQYYIMLSNGNNVHNTNLGN